jgi:hypothetical protein
MLGMSINDHLAVSEWPVPCERRGGHRVDALHGLVELLALPGVLVVVTPQVAACWISMAPNEGVSGLISDPTKGSATS